MEKSELRKLYLVKQRAISNEDRVTKSDAIAERFFSGFDLSAVNVLHCFIPIAKFNEVESLRIIGKIWSEFPAITVVVPRVDIISGEMKSLTFAPDTELVQNAWGISEPSHDRWVESREIDMVLVPGLCFDKQGHRVGYGKGFYDRFLRVCRTDCVKIGLSYFEPVDVIDDMHDGDIALDHIVTPFGVRSAERGMRNPH